MDKVFKWNKNSKKIDQNLTFRIYALSDLIWVYRLISNIGTMNNQKEREKNISNSLP